ncbi:unnamed protein product [Blepharisma stoltei]|uniref:Uncharacterized protein n=1 Tax=Blepharisma stoltei TaxID=1481888 RepID=A0AAU9J5V9_9CILI|nr:unnamed protein product [Blepharisma stoltei]
MEIIGTNMKFSLIYFNAHPKVGESCMQLYGMLFIILSLFSLKSWSSGIKATLKFQATEPKSLFFSFIS